MDPDARRGRVVDVALGRLHACGFALTTLDDIARAADVGAAELQAVFGDSEGLVQELLSPLVAGLRQVAAAAAASDLRQPGQLRTVIEAYYDVLVDHRLLVGVVVGDPAGAASASVRMARAAMADLRDTLAQGPGADLDHRIRAASALGAVQAAVIELTDLEASTVRDVVTVAALAILLP